MYCISENTGCYCRPHTHHDLGARMAFRPFFFIVGIFQEKKQLMS
jgi:hypothetical protein